MQIDITYDASVNKAPAGFEDGVNAAVQFLDSEFTNPVTINIDVGYGEVRGIPLGSGALGESEASRMIPESYSAVVNALVAQGAPGSSTLPATSPFTGVLEISPAEAKALGLLPESSSIDGYVGFSATPNIFSYAVGTAPPSNEYYFVGAVEHEITEDMGRVSLLDAQPFAYSVMDLYRYSAPGVRDLSTGGRGSTAYFSIDDGASNLATWNNNARNGDLGDWYGSNIPNGGNDSFNDFSGPGVVEGISPSDILVMQAIGWTGLPVPPTVTAQDLSLGENQSVAISSDFTVTNVAGDSITQYVFEDLGGGSGFFSVGGTAQPDGQVISVPVSDLSTVEYNSGSSPGVDSIQVGVFDATTDSYVWSSPVTATTTQYPDVQGNVDEWILSNGQLVDTAGPGSGPAGSQVAGIGDFNGDGTSDILWYNANTGDVTEWQMVNAAVAGTVDFGAHPGAGWHIAGIGDFNTDSTDDVLWTNSSGGQVQTDIWELSNGQWEASVSPGSHPAGYQVVGVGDFTSNGQSDILWYNPGTHDVDEWELSNGQWTASVDLGPHPGSGWQIAGIGDFNGDGTEDVLWTSSSNGQVQTDIWELSGGQWAASVSPGAHPGNSQVVAIGDFNGDGTSDILWHNPANGDLDEWVIANGQWAGSIDLGSHSGVGWQVAGAGDFTGGGTQDLLWHTSA